MLNEEKAALLKVLQATDKENEQSKSKFPHTMNFFK